MENKSEFKESMEIKSILKKSLMMYKENFSLFIGIIILGHAFMVLDTLRNIIFKNAFPRVIFIESLTAILGGFILIWASIALIIAVSHRYQNNSVTLKECFVAAKGIYWRYIAVSFLCGLIVLTGFLLFLIPGIYWGIIFSLATVVAVLERRRDIGPLRISKVLIRGYFWRVLLLWLIMLAFYLPLYFIYFVVGKTNQNLEIILLQIFLIFLAPFYVGVAVTLYCRLKDLKGGELQPESEIPIKSGKGCLGCLTTAGLVILIIVLSAFWLSGLNKFLKTEKGMQISEYVKEKISPQINFPGGVILERPKGWLVMKNTGVEIGYSLLNFGNRHLSGVKIWSIPIKELNISRQEISLDNQIIQNEILERTIKSSEMMKMAYEGYEHKPFKIIRLGNRSWGEYRLEEVKKKEYATVIKSFSNIYTIFDDYVLIVSYKYRLTELKGRDEFKDNFLKAENQIKDIITLIHFP